MLLTRTAISPNLYRESRKRKRDHNGSRDLLRNVILTALLDTLSINLNSYRATGSFLSNGGDSISAIKVHNKCKAGGVLLSVGTILTSPSFEELCRTACLDPNHGRRHSTDWRVQSQTALVRGSVPSIACLKPETEMQQVLALDSERNPGTNIIRFSQTFQTRHIPFLKAAWSNAMRMEAIFGEGSTDWAEQSCSTRRELDLIRERIPGYSTMVSKFSTLTAREEPELTTIIWDVHHALIDGYSMMLLYQRVLMLAQGHEVRAHTPFSQVAQALRSFQQDRSAMHKVFWEQQQASYRQARGRLQIAPPTAGPSAATMSIRWMRDDLQAWCRGHNVTLAALHYSAWSLVLSSYVDSDSVVFGAVLSGRTLPISGAKDTIGPLVNTLPFFVTINWSLQGKDYVKGVFLKLLKLQGMESSTPKDGFNRDFDSAMAMEIEMPSLDGVIQPVGDSTFNIQTGFPLSAGFNSKGQIKIQYQEHLGQDIGLLRRLYDQWLTALMTPDHILEHQAAQITRRCFGDATLVGGNLGRYSTTSGSVTEDLVTLFERVAVYHPGAIALKKENETVSYAELDNRAGRLAYAMQGVVKAGDVVCVHADRSINWLVAAYAVLKLGGVYAPSNLALPAHMQEINYRTSKAVLYLGPSIDEAQSAPKGASFLAVEEALKVERRCMPHRLVPQPESPAYLCFTSGSSGTPKAVLCHHAGLVAFQRDMRVRLYSQPGQHVAQVMSPAFDGSIHEVFSALSYGATLVLPVSLNDFRHLENCDSAILTPSLARVLNPEDYKRLREVYLVGEPVPQPVCDMWASRKRLFNMYGPTESTCGATIKELHPHEPVTIGKPNPSSRVYILDRHLRPCLPNVTGDIYIAGVQVAVGYLGLPELNAQRFLSDPFCLGERMYFTGDRGTWTHSHEVRCLGRADRQIKLNGFRLDLNLLEEQILEEVPQVTAVALVKKDNYLVAAVVPSSVDVDQLRSQIATTLPLYATPRHFIPMDTLPETAISKTDYSAIEALDVEILPENKPSLGKLEHLIERTWKDILGLDSQATLCPRAPMLEHGGDSLAQLMLFNRLNEAIGRPGSLGQVIQAPTIHDLALAIEKSPSQPSNTLSTAAGHMISSLEADWIQKYESSENSSAFNVSAAWEFDPAAVDYQLLTKAWNTVLAQHDFLNSYYVKSQGRWTRAYHNSPPTVELVDIVEMAPAVDRPFQLQSDHLIRVILSPSSMLVVISHILCDLTTLKIVLKDVAALYADSSRPVTAAPSGPSAKQYEPSQRDLDYWKGSLATAPPLATWKQIPARRSFAGHSDARWLPKELLHQLTKFSHQEHFTLHQLALAATALTLQHQNKNIDLVLGAPFFNRSSEELTKTGLFLEPLPIRISHVCGNEKATKFLDTVKQASQRALAHHVPWFDLVESLGSQCTPPENPFFDVMVTFHDLRQEELLPITGLQQLQSWSAGSKFKLMVELTAFDDNNLLLRLECDTGCFSEADIDKVHGLIAQALASLPTGMDTNALQKAMISDTLYIGERASIGSPIKRFS